MKTSYAPYQECEGRWQTCLMDLNLPEKVSDHAKVPETKAKIEKPNPLILDAQRRVGESETTNPLIKNARKRAATKMEVA